MAPLRRWRRSRGARPCDTRGSTYRGVSPDRFADSRYPGERLYDRDVRGKAVLLHTGWDRHFGTPAYGEPAPFLTADGVAYLHNQGVMLVGIDSLNIDDTSADAAGQRPAHTEFLAHGIHVVEHLTNRGELPPSGALFTAVPPKFEGTGTFTVRALAKVPA
jgi:arylformamidase